MVKHYNPDEQGHTTRGRCDVISYTSTEILTCLIGTCDGSLIIKATEYDAVVVFIHLVRW